MSCLISVQLPQELSGLARIYSTMSQDQPQRYLLFGIQHPAGFRAKLESFDFSPPAEQSDVSIESWSKFNATFARIKIICFEIAN